MIRNNLQIYIHIPFCVRKCAYCDFLSGPASDETIAQYVEKLMEEIGVYGTLDLAKKNVVTSIFFGGGTPSILSGNQMHKIMDALKRYFTIHPCAEVSMEANPGTVTKENMLEYRQAGINRISLGLQSTNNDELKVLGRIHTYEEFLESYQLARECGFDNINVDLISAIPGQTVESWEESIKKIVSLNPEHISAYSLIIEEGTPFYERYGEQTEGASFLPSEEAEREMYHRTKVLLQEAGYHRYEISNYAKEGRECRHNIGYWERKNYLGLGLGASSLIDNVRYKNTEDMFLYLSHIGDLDKLREETEELSVVAQMEEYVFLGLRKMEGVSKRAFLEVFGKTLDECYGNGIRKMKEEQLLEEIGDMLCLTDRGIDVSNYVFAEILYE